MQIACPKCSARYELDDRLVPSGSAPVQCTSCKFVFTAKPVAAPGVGQAAPQSPSPPKTQIFGTRPLKSVVPASAPEKTKPSGAIGSAPARSAPWADPAAAEKIHFGNLATPIGAHLPANETIVFGSTAAVPARTPAPNSALQTQIFGKGSLADLALGLAPEPPRPAKVELPPANLPFAAQAPDDSVQVEDFKPFMQRHRGAFVVVVVLALLGGLGVRFLTRRKPSVPPEAAAIHELAIGLLRRDDAASKQEAVKQLEQLTQSYPAYTQAKPTRLLALSLQWDDAQMELQQNKAAADALSRKIAATEEKKASTDWQNRVNDMNDRLRALRAQESPLKEGVTSLAKRAAQALATLETFEDLASLRAQAVYQGVNASEQAIGLSEKYRSLGGNDGWDVIAYAEFAVNAKAAPEIAAKGRFALERLRTADPAFVRAYLLGARLEIQNSRYDAAATLLDAAVALNPAHDAARRTLAWVQNLQPPSADRLP